jgi:hypothetical protein
MASIAVNFLVGQSFARSLGVSTPSNQNACGFLMAAAGMTGIGALLTRQVALQRAASEQAAAQAAQASSDTQGAAGGGTGKTPKPA